MVQYNTTANPLVPDVYLNNLTPGQIIQGAPTSLGAVVGTATWGPVNSATAVSASQYQALFGVPQNRLYDAGTAIAAAGLAGGNNFMVARVTDGTDTAASFATSTASAVVTTPGSGYAISDIVTFANGAKISVLTVTTGGITTFTQLTGPTANTVGAIAQASTTGAGTAATFTFTYTTAITATSKYTGSGANADTVTISPGTAVGTWKVTLGRAGLNPEVFDNIGAGLSGLPLWTAIVNAVNNGTAARGASNLMVFTVGTSTAVPLTTTYTLGSGVTGSTPGADGASTITAAVLTGVDNAIGNRTGIYAVRGIGPHVLVVANAPTTMWSTIVAFALTEGGYAVVSGPSGDYANLTLIATLAGLGIDSTAIKVLSGDWLLYNDPNNGPRFIEPSGFAMGRLISLAPSQVGVGKAINGISGSQSQAAPRPYSAAQLGAISAGRLDVITPSGPGGNFWQLRLGRNAASNGAINLDNYSRMVPYLSSSIGNNIGAFVGRLITPQETNDLNAAIDGFLGGLQTQGWIGVAVNPGVVPPKPYTISFISTASQLAQGIQIVNVSVTLYAAVVDLIVNLTAGSTVIQATANAATGAL